MNLAVTAAAFAMILGLSGLHVWAFRRQPHPRRLPYLLVLAAMVFGTLLIPISGGGGHLETIRLWVPYRMMAVPEFYSSGNRNLVIDGAVIGLPLIHQIACVCLASIAVRRRISTNSPKDGISM